MNDTKARTSFIAYYALIWMTSAIVGPFQNVYFYSKGFSVLQIGVLASIGSVVSLLMQPVWGVVSDQVRSRMKLLRLMFIGTAVLILSYILGQKYWHFVLIKIVYTAFTCSTKNMSDVYTMGFIHKNHLRFSYIRMAGTLGYAFAVFILGRALKSAPLVMIYVISAVMNFLCMGSTFLLPKMNEEDYAKRVKREKAVSGGKSNYREILTPAMLTISLFTFVMQIAMSYHSSFMGIFVKKMGESETMIGILQCCSAMSEVPVLLVIDRIRQKFSNTAILVFSGFMMALRMISCALVPEFGLGMLFVSQLLQGVTYMNIHFCSIMFISDHIPEHLRGTALSILRVAQGSAGAMVASIGGGYLSDHFGMNTTYMTITVLVLIASTVLLLKHRRDAARGTEE